MRCPACGESPSWCLGHGPIGDPAGAALLDRHDNGFHAACNPAGCEQSPIHNRALTRKAVLS